MTIRQIYPKINATKRIRTRTKNLLVHLLSGVGRVISHACEPTPKSRFFIGENKMKILWLNSEITLLQETTKRLYFGCEIVLPRLVTSVTTDPEGNVFGWGVILDQDNGTGGRHG